MNFAALIGKMTRAQLWKALVVSAVVNLGVICYVAAYVPMVRLQPTCWDENAPAPFRPVAEVPGELAWPFMEAYEKALAYSQVDHAYDGRHLYVTIADWLDRDRMLSVSTMVVEQLLKMRTGSSVVRGRRLGLADFDNAPADQWPPCSGVRKLALLDGEWAYEGRLPVVTKPER